MHLQLSGTWVKKVHTLIGQQRGGDPGTVLQTGCPLGCPCWESLRPAGPLSRAPPPLPPPQHKTLGVRSVCSLQWPWSGPVHCGERASAATPLAWHSRLPARSPPNACRRRQRLQRPPNTHTPPKRRMEDHALPVGCYQPGACTSEGRAPAGPPGGRGPDGATEAGWLRAALAASGVGGGGPHQETPQPARWSLSAPAPQARHGRRKCPGSRLRGSPGRATRLRGPRGLLTPLRRGPRPRR